jgi:hypothetical protein
MDSREVAMDKISISCAKECKLLNVTGVLTLDNEAVEIRRLGH